MIFKSTRGYGFVFKRARSKKKRAILHNLLTVNWTSAAQENEDKVTLQTKLQ